MNVLTPDVLELLAQLEISTRDLSEARTMPGGVYTSEEFFRFEFESIFATEWLCLGHHSQIPEPGDYFTVQMTDEPLIVVRGEDGEIRVMSAICQHRGYPITNDAPEGNARNFRCPYHYWAYGLDGSLIAAPEMQKTCDLGQLKAEAFLPRMKVEMWNGLIFANMDLDAAPLAPTITKLGEDMANYDVEHLVSMPPLDYPNQPWNWKGMHENALEPYHTSYVHKGYHEMAPAVNAQFVDWDDDDGQIMHPTYFRHIDGAVNPTLKAMLPILPGLNEDQRSRVMFASIPPTVFFALMPDQVFMFLIFPESANSMHLRIQWLFPPSTLRTPNFQWIYDSQTGANDILNQQDMHTNETMQKGQRSRFTPRGRYAHQEATLPQFNRWLVKRYRRYLERLGMDPLAPTATAGPATSADESPVTIGGGG